MTDYMSDWKVRQLYKEQEQELRLYKRAFENACKAYADAVRGTDIDLFRRDMLEDAMEEQE